MTIPVISPVSGTFTWVDATTNTDGSAIAAGEITGYQIGVRSATAQGSVAGTYPILLPTAAASATSEAVSAATPMLQPDTYFAAIRSTGPLNSAWTSELEFTIAQPVPQPPSGFSVG